MASVVSGYKGVQYNYSPGVHCWGSFLLLIEGSHTVTLSRVSWSRQRGNVWVKMYLMSGTGKVIKHQHLLWTTSPTRSKPLSTTGCYQKKYSLCREKRNPHLFILPPHSWYICIYVYTCVIRILYTYYIHIYIYVYVIYTYI